MPGFADLDEALALGPHAAVVATPANQHVKIATRLAAAGLHVLIEKPLDVCVDGIEPLTKAAADRGVLVAVAYVYRCVPALAAMRTAVLSGRFGRPVELVAVSGQNFPTYRPAYRDTYYINRATGGARSRRAHPSAQCRRVASGPDRPTRCRRGAPSAC